MLFSYINRELFIGYDLNLAKRHFSLEDLF
jgi:hypothetical protein